VPIPDRLCAPLACLLGYGAKGRLFNISGTASAPSCARPAFAAGIDPVTPHDLRRTYITRLLASGRRPGNRPTSRRAQQPENHRRVRSAQRERCRCRRRAVFRRGDRMSLVRLEKPLPLGHASVSLFRDDVNTLISVNFTRAIIHTPLVLSSTQLS